jgi:nucleoside-diphosphate-sugar epimerase
MNVSLNPKAVKNVLITGATGFLGSKLTAKLLDFPEAYRVTALKRSQSNTWRIAHLTDLRLVDIGQEPLADLFATARFDIIIHCATDYGRNSAAQSDIVETNLLLPVRLLDLGIQHGLSVFVNTDTMLDKGVSSYTLSKRQFREWLENTASRIVGVNVVLEHFYGAGDNQSKFVTRVIRDLIAEVPSIALTRGEQKRDFIYIDDVVEAFVCILARVATSRPACLDYQVGTGNSVTLREFMSTAYELCGRPCTQLDFGAIAYRPNEPMDVKVDLAPLHALGWSPRWPLRQGLATTISSERRLFK